MILQVLDVMGRPQTIEASRVVVLCDDGVTPVAVAVQHPGGFVEVGQQADRAGRPDPAFARMLEAHGLDRSIVWARAPLRSLSDFRFNGRKG